MTHTPTPWRCRPFLTPDKDEDPMMVYLVEAGDLQQRFNSVPTDEAGDYDQDALAAIHAENAANAEFIERACNSHDDLLSACKNTLAKLQARPDPHGVFERDRAELSAAIAHAQGQEAQP